MGTTGYESLRVKNNAYSPYSGFKVGLVLTSTEGYTGCNIENASYGVQYAQNARLFMRCIRWKTDIAGIAITSDGDYTFPAVCDSVMAEF